MPNGELAFGIRCQDEIVLSGYFIPIGKEVTIDFVYDGNTAFFYIDKSLVQETDISFTFACPGSLDIGSYGVTTQEVWVGKILFVQIFD